ncbi:MAG: DUF3368 domain-containing protein [Leptospiraceae bacterium]|nr:DUF3368 domain-containing protein [Leptospiraceae bacterium]
MNSFVVSNTSPLILLFNLELEYILKMLFKRIVVPEQVYNEILLYTNKDRASFELPKCDWIEVIKVDIQKEILEWDLGLGESAVISYALKNNNSIILIDDRLGKKCAEVYNIKAIGTARLLLLAKENKIISEVRPLLEKIKEKGLWISNEILYLILKKAGEYN